MQQTYSHTDFARERAWRSRLLALRSRLAGDQFIAALDRYQDGLFKGGYDPNQPRIPAGQDFAGRWSGGLDSQPGPIPLLPDFLANFNDAIAGAAGGLELPTLGDAPALPTSQPAAGQAVTAVVRDAARWLQSAKDVGASSQARGFFDRLMDTSWLRSHMPRIVSYLDDPKTEQELQEAASKPRAGFAIHHRNERAAALVAGYPKVMVNGRANLMLVPKIRHWDVTGWYMKRTEDYGGLSPRQYLLDKNWETRRQVGNRALRIHGILTP